MIHGKNIRSIDVQICAHIGYMCNAIHSFAMRWKFLTRHDMRAEREMERNQSFYVEHYQVPVACIVLCWQGIYTQF